MFGNLSHFGKSSRLIRKQRVRPLFRVYCSAEPSSGSPSLPEARRSTEPIPAATPVHLPHCQLEFVFPQSDNPGDLQSSNLPALLQSLARPADQVTIAHLEALGVHVVADVSIDDLIPDASCIPDFGAWDTLSREEALIRDATSRPVMCNNKQAPGAAKYVELRQGLSTDNDRAFRSVRRLTPRPGETYVRLGYTHDFFRSLENLTSYWDDTSAAQADTNQVGAAHAGDNQDFQSSTSEEDHVFYRTSAGHSMPPIHRAMVLTSFLKLVTYDFSCTIAAHQDARLYIKTQEPKYMHTSFSSACNFIRRIPTDRDSARRGIVEGPIAAVSARHSLSFPPVGGDRDSLIDLSREIIAALITAQYRSWEGKEMQQIGKDSWWATRPRWGGGPGGPIGKEVEAQELGTVEEKPSSSSSPVDGDTIAPTDRSSSSRASHHRASLLGALLHRPSSASSLPQPPNAKRPRRGQTSADEYRNIRAPSAHWDPKTRYTAIGRQQAADFDDIFVISCLFHHVSVLRVRVPDKLSQSLSGTIVDPGLAARGKLEIRRTRWYDLYVIPDRLEAMKVVWAVMAYSMRMVPTEKTTDKTSSDQQRGHMGEANDAS
ncbi:hypothetical protein BD289DRAFT_203160 [Coniella lustricola]|uniref:Uncharacterized protein n=1 Tax=Coniella lustricola TaxID=2025994 RepID=A0A2T3AC95_9PEZI|nr:hypothetical protein BD289DRAFT_203160 [Coniella lustricola]